MQLTTKTYNPLLWVPTGYFTMALMLNLLTAASVIMFSNLGMDNAQATAYAGMLGIAYSLKPGFASFLEMYRTKKFFVLSCQVLIGLGLFGVAAILQMPNYLLALLVLFWVLSFLGSAQDITTDGVYITSLNPKRQAIFTGVQGLAWNMGRLVVLSVFIGLAGWLHQSVFNHDPKVNGDDWRISWQIVFIVAGVWYLLIAAWHYKVMPDGAKAENPPTNFGEAIVTLKDTFVTFFQKKDVWLMIGFAFLFRISYGFLSSPSMLFMKDSLEAGGLALSNQEMGFLYGTVGTGAQIVGALLGGFIVANWGLKNVLFKLCIAFNVPNITFLFLAIYQPSSFWLIGLGIGLEQFFFGLGATGFMIYLMQQLSPGKYRMAHYAFGTALMQMCMNLTGMVSGTIETSLGYTNYFIFVMIVTIPSFLIAWYAPFHIKESDAK